MHESDAELAELQRALDHSYASSGPHLRATFTEESRPSARELVDLLPGIIEVHLAVLAGDGAPLVAPVDAIVFRGRLWIGLPEASLRGRLVRRDPRVSASYTNGAIGLIVHGRMVEATEADDLEAFGRHARELYVAQYGDWFDEYLDRKLETEGPGFTGWVEPRAVFAKR